MKKHWKIIVKEIEEELGCDSKEAKKVYDKRKLEPSVKVKKDDDARGKILAVLEKQKGGLSLKEVGQEIGTAWQGLTGIVKGLCQEDILVKKGNIYFLAQQ